MPEDGFTVEIGPEWLSGHQVDDEVDLPNAGLGDKFGGGQRSGGRSTFLDGKLEPPVVPHGAGRLLTSRTASWVLSNAWLANLAIKRTNRSMLLSPPPGDEVADLLANSLVTGILCGGSEALEPARLFPASGRLRAPTTAVLSRASPPQPEGVVPRLRSGEMPFSGQERCGRFKTAFASWWKPCGTTCSDRRSWE